MPHKFAAGQTVEYFALDGRFGGPGLDTIIRLLPEDAGNYQYHIQRTDGSEQRCAREAQLRSASPSTLPPPQQSDRPGHVGGSSRRVRLSRSTANARHQCAPADATLGAAPG